MGQAYQELQSWLIAKSNWQGDLDLDADLIEEKVLNSLLFVEFVMMIEDLTGNEIDVDENILETLKTLNLVRQHYFGEL